jgi:tetratricopeptide (TPR) repeat protein
MNVGAITIRFRDYKTAQEKFAKVVSLEPKNFEAQVSLGVAYRGNGEYEKARDTYMTAQKIDPSQPSTYYNLGTLYQDYPISEPGYDKAPWKKLEKAVEHYKSFKSKAGSKDQWAPMVKDVEKRVEVCNQLIKATKAASAAAKP